MPLYFVDNAGVKKFLYLRGHVGAKIPTVFKSCFPYFNRSTMQTVLIVAESTFATNPFLYTVFKTVLKKIRLVIDFVKVVIDFRGELPFLLHFIVNVRP